jgi:periplasmic copper chaperone A
LPGTFSGQQSTPTVMKTTMLKHAVVSATAFVTVILVTGGIVSAHIEPDPLAMQVGTSGTVAFNVEHGCDGSPMTDLKIQIPSGVTGVAPVAKDGWTATFTGDTVEFKGGPLDATTEDHFEITLTTPTTAGDIHFPAIEICQVGEIDWIEIPAEGAAEPENPAPTIKITTNPPTAAELTPASEAPEGSADTVVATGTDTGITTTATTAPAKDSSNTGTIVVVVIIVVIVLAGGGIILARRKNAPPPA